MIYTDGVHLICDEREETLHAFARSIGLRREWYQDEGHRHPHYDLTTTRMRNKALSAGAVLVTSRELICILKKKNTQ